MAPEQLLAEFVTGFGLAELPPEARRTTQLVALASLGAGVAGAGEDGIAALRALLRQRGGRAEARTLVFGDALPAVAAAQLNATMCRALDFDDAMAPGPHFGAALLPAALAAAELRGGCSGAELLCALALGLETGARFNLDESQYAGLDPTGVAVVFASTAAASRVLGLGAAQARHALGLAFDRCGGSFQSNIDGSLAVRVIQGWVAATGVDCAQLAAAGITGPSNFITGVYGYPQLYGRGRLDAGSMVAGLGQQWRLQQVMFKKYPSCGATQGMTELLLQLAQEIDLQADAVESLEVRQPPYSHRLVGHDWCSGDNPRVDAQFSSRYCAANAIVRRASTLAHFRPDAIADPAVQALIPRVHAVGDAALDGRGHTAVDIELRLKSGAVHRRSLDIAPGFPGHGLSDAQHLERFADCMAYAPQPLAPARVQALLAAIGDLAMLADARELVTLLIA